MTMNFKNSFPQVSNPNTYPNSLTLSVVLPSYNSCFKVNSDVSKLISKLRFYKLILFPT